MNIGTAIDQAAIVVAQQIAAFADRQMLGEVAPRLGEDCAHAMEEPFDLLLRAEKDAAQDEAAGAFRMADAVGQRERAAPRAAEKQPPRDAEMNAQLLHVADQMAGRVVVQVAERHRSPAPALVEYDDPIELRIEEAAMDRRRACARATMQEDDRNAVRIAALLPVDRVSPVDRQHAAGVGGNLPGTGRNEEVSLSAACDFPSS